MKTSVITLTIVAIVVSVALLSTAVFATGLGQYWHPYLGQTQAPGYGGGMMGGYYGGGGGGMMGGYGTSSGNGYASMMTTQGQPVAIQEATHMMQSIPSYARVISENNTIAFDSQHISIFALAIMPDRAINLTGMQPPSYSKDDVFVIYGLINPILEIPRGTSVNFTIVNLDDDMYHNMVISSISPPYPYMSMQGMMHSSNWQSRASSYFPVMSMMPFLPPADYAQGSAHEYSYELAFNQSGDLWYLCTYPGHAQSGMYGQIVVTG